MGTITQEKKSESVMQIIQNSKQRCVYNHEFDLYDTDDDVIISFKIHVSKHDINKCSLLVNAKYHFTNYMVNTTKPTLFCAQ